MKAINMMIKNNNKIIDEHILFIKAKVKLFKPVCNAYINLQIDS